MQKEVKDELAVASAAAEERAAEAGGRASLSDAASGLQVAQELLQEKQALEMLATMRAEEGHA